MKTTEEDWQRLTLTLGRILLKKRKELTYLCTYLSLAKVQAAADINSSFKKYINRSIQQFAKKYSTIIENCEIDSDDHLISLQNLFDVVAEAGPEGAF